MPISEKQLQANRKNAKKSTGPRTPQGKATAAKNSTRHGIFSPDILIEGESEETFRTFARELIAQLDPAPGLESDLVDSIITCRWRLRRIRGMEAAALTSQILINAAARPEDADKTPVHRASDAWRSMADSNKLIDSMHRYEVRLDRQYYRALDSLEGHRARKSEKNVILRERTHLEELQ